MLKDLYARHVLPETTILALVCLLDTVSTVFLVHQGLAVEANPLLAWTFEQSTATFVAVKIATFALPLAIFEILRRRHSKLVQKGLRVAIVGYLGVYIGLSFLVNLIR
jgi:hypothetical protein